MKLTIYELDKIVHQLDKIVQWLSSIRKLTDGHEAACTACNHSLPSACSIIWWREWIERLSKNLDGCSISADWMEAKNFRSVRGCRGRCKGHATAGDDGKQAPFSPSQIFRASPLKPQSKALNKASFAWVEMCPKQALSGSIPAGRDVSFFDTFYWVWTNLRGPVWWSFGNGRSNRNIDRGGVLIRHQYNPVNNQTKTP